MDPELHACIEDILAAVEGAPAPFRAVVQNILDEPIPKMTAETKASSSGSRTQLETRKAILNEFDPIVTMKNSREGPPQFLPNKDVERLHLREYRAVVH